MVQPRTDRTEDIVTVDLTTGTTTTSTRPRAPPQTIDLTAKGDPPRLALSSSTTLRARTIAAAASTPTTALTAKEAATGSARPPGQTALASSHRRSSNSGSSRLVGGRRVAGAAKAAAVSAPGKGTKPRPVSAAKGKQSAPARRQKRKKKKRPLQLGPRFVEHPNDYDAGEADDADYLPEGSAAVKTPLKRRNSTSSQPQRKRSRASTKGPSTATSQALASREAAADKQEQPATDDSAADRIPEELWVKILASSCAHWGALPLATRAACVCTKWRAAAAHPLLWRKLDLSYGWCRVNHTVRARHVSHFSRAVSGIVQYV